MQGTVDPDDGEEVTPDGVERIIEPPDKQLKVKFREFELDR
jgi:hypothetical protein